MKVFRVSTVLLLLVYCVVGQTSRPSGPAFDIQDFTKKFEVAEWLVEYDNVAWKTTDVVMEQPKSELARLGQEWFCFQDKNKVWHAVYGKLTGEKYEAVFHFEMDLNDKITKSTQPIDQDFLNKHAVALRTGRAKLTSTIPEGSPRFNQYIRQNSDKSFSVWLMPAFQPNRTAVFGGEAIYTIDVTGTKILKDESYFQKDFRGFKTDPPREIWLNYSEMDKPSLGAIFFVWYYRQYFTQIFIQNAKSTSTAIKTPDGYIWTHVDKADPDKPVDQPDPGQPKLQRKKPGE